MSEYSGKTLPRKTLGHIEFEEGALTSWDKERILLWEGNNLTIAQVLTSDGESAHLASQSWPCASSPLSLFWAALAEYPRPDSV